MTEPSPSILDECPFYFIVVFWGDEFRELFLNLCLPSLLAPGNIPALVNKRDARFIIATTLRDWNAIRKTPLIGELQNYIEPLFIEISTPQADDNKFVVMTRAHTVAADLAIAGKAFGVFLCPDALLADGAVVHLQDRARSGAKVVLVAALRHTQETFLADLYAHPSYRADKPLVLSPRELVRLSLLHLHPQTLLRDWDSDRFSVCPGFCFWRAPDQDGLILHNTRWGPLLFNYGDLKKHDTRSNLGEGCLSVDDDYVYRNYGLSSDIQVVTDSDDVTYVSLTPASVAAPEVTTAGNSNKRICMRINAYSGIMDPLQWALFRKHIRFHTRDITGAWEKKEHLIDRTLERTLRSSPSWLDRKRFESIIGGAPWHPIARLKAFLHRILGRLKGKFSFVRS